MLPARTSTRRNLTVRPHCISQRSAEIRRWSGCSSSTARRSTPRPSTSAPVPGAVGAAGVGALRLGRGRQGQSALTEAAVRGRARCVERLLGAGALRSAAALEAAQARAAEEGAPPPPPPSPLSPARPLKLGAAGLEDDVRAEAQETIGLLTS